MDKRAQPEVASNKHQAQESSSTLGHKPQATSDSKKDSKSSSDKQQASWFLNPSLTSAKIQVPGNNLQEPWLGFLASINVLFGCLIWNAIWCGLNRILLSDVIFSSTVKKWPKVLYPNRSGVPNREVFSILVHDILGVILLSSCHNFVSGFIKIMTITPGHTINFGLPIGATSSCVEITIRCVSLAPIILFSTKFTLITS